MREGLSASMARDTFAPTQVSHYRPQEDEAKIYTSESVQTVLAEQLVTLSVFVVDFPELCIGYCETTLWAHRFAHGTGVAPGTPPGTRPPGPDR